jgi:cytochrome P450
VNCSFLLTFLSRARKAKEFIDNLAHTAIAEAEERNNKLAEGERSENLLSPFLNLDVSELPIQRDQYLRDVMVSFLVAGRDTTSTALAFFFYLMAMNPVEQERLHQEISQRFVRGSAMSWDLVDGSLPFLTACIKECLRLYPPVPVVSGYNYLNVLLPFFTVEFRTPKLL